MTEVEESYDAVCNFQIIFSTTYLMIECDEIMIILLFIQCQHHFTQHTHKISIEICILLLVKLYQKAVKTYNCL